MKPTAAPLDIQSLLTQAEIAAGRLCRRYRSHLLEHEDVRQDLLLDLVARLKLFDAAQSSLPTFAAICFQHRSTRLTRLLQRELQARHPAALDARIRPDSNRTLADTISEGDGYAAWIGQPVDAVGRVEYRLDLDRALTSLTDDAVPLCTNLLSETADPAAAAGLSRTTRHRRVRELRCQLLAAGVGNLSGTSQPVAG